LPSARGGGVHCFLKKKFQNEGFWGGKREFVEAFLTLHFDWWKVALRTAKGGEKDVVLTPKEEGGDSLGPRVEGFPEAGKGRFGSE